MNCVDSTERLEDLMSEMRCQAKVESLDVDHKYQ
jgi:hypothetical protein